MAVNLTDRLSALATDAVGVTHVVWVEDAAIWHAVYDDNAAAWMDAQIIATVGQQKVIGLNLVASETLITGNNQPAPGLAVVYQQGSENESNFFYTAAQYNSSGGLQWLAQPQSLTADAVADLEPRAIVYNNQGTAEVVVVGQKVNTDQATNQAVREDTDLYYESFSVSSTQFASTPASGSGVNSPFINPVAKPTSLEADPRFSSQKASYSVLSTAESAIIARRPGYQGKAFNWSGSNTFSTGAIKFLIRKANNEKANKFIKDTLKGISVSITIQGTAGSNPEWSLFGGGNSTNGKLLLNVIASIGRQVGSPEKSPFQKERTTNNQQNTVDVSVDVTTLYSFEANSGNGFPLSIETGGFLVTLATAIPLLGSDSITVRNRKFSVGQSFSFFANVGIALQWQLSPKDPETYKPLLAPFLDDKGKLLIIDSLAIGLPLFSDVGAITAILSNIVDAFKQIDNNSPNGNLNLDSFILAIPINAGFEYSLEVPYVFKFAAKVGGFLQGLFNIPINSEDKFYGSLTLGIPASASVNLLGLYTARVAVFPTWTWFFPKSSTLPTLLPTASDDLVSPTTSSTAIVDGSLLTINVSSELASNLNLRPSDFTVTVTNANGSQSTIPIFDVVIQGNAVILRLEQAILYATLNDQPLSDNIKVTYSGNQLNGFTSATVINNSTQNLTYTYDPTRGSQALYENKAQQITINFNTSLNTQKIPNPDFFTITTANNTTLQLAQASSAIQINPKSLVLTLASSLPAGEDYTVFYNPSGTDNILTTASNQPISAFSIHSANQPTFAGSVNSTFANSANISQIAPNTNNDLAQDSAPALSLTNSGQVLIAWSSDAPYLLPLSAIASGSSVYLSFSADLGNSQTSENLPSLDQFTIVINGKSVAVTELAIANNTVTLGLAEAVTSIDQVTVSYQLVNNDPSTNLFFTDPTQTQFWIQPFANVAVNQATDNVANPALLSLTLGSNSYQAYALGQIVVIPFNRPLSAQKSIISGDDFVVDVNNQAISIVNATVSETSVILSLGTPITNGTSKALIGQGDVVAIAYNPVSGHRIVDTDGKTADPFAINRFQVLTTPASSSSVIKTTFYPFGESNVSPLTTIPGVAGLNSDPALISHGPTQSNVAVWVNVDTSNVPLQLIPGQNYTREQAQTINNALSASDIYYSILGPGNQWSVATPIASVQTGQDQKVTLGTLPNGDIIAAWLNTQQDNGTGETTTDIFWSSWNGSRWTTPQTLLTETTPDAFSELRITDLDGQTAIFWTESQPTSYSTFVDNDNPQVYLRLGELTGTTAINSGEYATIEGNYSGSFKLNQPGALEQSANRGDPNPAVLLEGGGVTLNGAIPLSSQGFSVELWFNLPNLPGAGQTINLASMAGVFGLTVSGTSLNFNLANAAHSSLSTTQALTAGTWYYVVGTYDNSRETLSLYLNGTRVGNLEPVNFSDFPKSGQFTLAGSSGQMYLDEVAFYNQVLTSTESSNAGLSAADAINLNGNDLIDGTLGVDQIGNHYQARFVDPVPSGPEVHYSMWDSVSNTWQAPSQIDPIPEIVPTILADANYPVWDIVAADLSPGPGNTSIFPNQHPDQIFQVTLNGYQGQEITGIAVTVPGNSNLLWGVGQKSDGTSIGGHQVGVILGETVTNSGLSFTNGARLLNSLDASVSGLSHQIRAEIETLNLFIDTGGNSVPGNPTITVYVKNRNGETGSITPSVLPLPNQGGKVAANSTDYLDTQVLGIATVTEANDASLANIDSGFVINTNNTAIGTVATSAFSSAGSLAYVALGNRGFAENQGKTVIKGTVQILFPGGEVLSGTETNALTTTDLLGNPDGILVTGLADAGTVENNVALSMATGYIAGNTQEIPDLVIGDANANNGNGAIYVLYGTYLSANKDKIIDVTGLTATPTTMGFVVHGVDTGGAAGYAVTVGDFDDDTYADIAYGAPQAKNSDGIVVGKVYLIKGFPPSSPPSSVTANLIYTGKAESFDVKQNDGSNKTVTVGEAAGYTLSSSNSEGKATTFAGSDHRDDLIVGAPGYPISVDNQWQGKEGLPSDSQGLFAAAKPITAGAVYVFAGSTNGLSASPSFSFAGPNVPAANGVAANYLAGSSLASGDLDGDGQKDLAISALGVNANAGAVYVLKGGSASPDPNMQFLNAVSNLTINGGIPSSKAGSVVSFPGDMNGDGYQDFLITAPQAGNGTGQSYLLFGPLGLDGTGNLFDLSVTGGDKAFLLNGSLPYQIAGTAAVGLGNITGKRGVNNTAVDSLLITAPNAQQVYTIYGQTYLEDDGSIKLADVSSDNGFVIDGNAFSTFKVVNPVIPNQGTNETTALVSYQGTLYMAIKGEGSNQGIFWTTSQDNGTSWSPAVPIFADGATNVSPSLAVDEQGTLYLAYLGLDPLLNIMYSSDGGKTWSPQYQIHGQTSTNSPTLVFYQNHLFTFFTAQDSSSRILYVYSDNPQSSDSWSIAYPVTYNNGADSQTSPTAVSATVLNNTLYLAYQTGNQINPSQGVDVTSTTGTDLSSLSWSLTSVPTISTEQAPSLTNDGQSLYLINTTNIADADQTLYLSASADGVLWTTSQLPGTSNYTPASTVLEKQLYLVRSTGSTGMEVLSSTLPPLGEIANNGSIVQSLGDINGDGFADFFSGGLFNGAIVFGASTKDLLDAASGTDDLILAVQNALLQEVISLGDFNGDGLQDFGVLDSNKNFYLILGNIDLAQTRQLSISPDLPYQPSISAASSIGDYNGDGYDDIWISKASSNLVYLGNAGGNLENTAILSSVTIAASTAAGVDINGNGYDDTAIGGFADLFAVFLLEYPNKLTGGIDSVESSSLQRVGDFNGDGIEDLAVLASNYSAAGGTYANAVLVYYGSLGGLSNSVQPNVTLVLGDDSRPSILSTLSMAGDVNGDGFDDVLIRSPLAVSPDSQGSIFVVFGGESWASSPFSLESLSNNQNQGSNVKGFVVEGPLDSRAGISVSGGADGNGDGFDDLIIGAKGTSLSYVLFGSDFNHTVNQTGTIGDDVILGTATGESFVASQGDDQIYTGGGLDVVYAGPGDDWVEVTDTYFRRLDGGPGLDVLELHGYNGQAWDLTTLAPGVRLQDFEVIDTRNYGANTLTLNALTVTKMSSNNTLVVLMDEADNLVLNADFQPDGTTYQYGEKYYQYTVKDSTANKSSAKVLVSQAKAPTYTAPSVNKPAAILPPSQASAVTAALESQRALPSAANNSTLSDPNSPTQLFVSSPTVSEQMGLATFSIQRSGNLNRYTLVSYQTVDEDGKAGGRYLPVAGRLVFAPGEGQKSVTVNIPNDGIYTGDRQFGLLVSLLEEGLALPTGPGDLKFQVNPNGEQIRRWNYDNEQLENSLMAGPLSFSTTVSDGQAQVTIFTDGTGDFNDFFNYSPRTSRYESLLSEHGSGAVFTYANSPLSDTPTGIQLQLKDGDWGDADGVANGLVKTQGYLGRTNPGLITANNQVFLAPTTADGQVQFRLIDAPTVNYELGWMAVDSAQGQIDGFNPGEPGYLEAARQRLSQPALRQVLFQNDAGAARQALSSGLAQQSFVDPIALVSSEQQFFGTLARSQLTANQPYVLYSLVGSQLQLSSLQTPQIALESRGYQSLFFAGFTAEIGSNALVVPGTLGQSVTMQAALSRAADYQNLIALYPVDSLTGGLDLDGDSRIDVRPGDSDYTRQALARAEDPVTGVTVSTPTNLDTRQETIHLLGNSIYGMVIIPNASIADVLSQNPDNLGGEVPQAFFSFGLANPDGISHMARLGNNLFGFEDQLGGGDLDYNDMVFQLQAA